MGRTTGRKPRGGEEGIAEREGERGRVRGRAEEKEREEGGGTSVR